MNEVEVVVFVLQYPPHSLFLFSNVRQQLMELGFVWPIKPTARELDESNNMSFSFRFLYLTFSLVVVSCWLHSCSDHFPFFCWCFFFCQRNLRR